MHVQHSQIMPYAHSPHACSAPPLPQSKARATCGWRWRLTGRSISHVSEQAAPAPRHPLSSNYVPRQLSPTSVPSAAAAASPSLLGAYPAPPHLPAPACLQPTRRTSPWPPPTCATRCWRCRAGRLSASPSTPGPSWLGSRRSRQARAGGQAAAAAAAALDALAAAGAACGCDEYLGSGCSLRMLMCCAVLCCVVMQDYLKDHVLSRLKKQS